MKRNKLHLLYISFLLFSVFSFSQNNWENYIKKINKNLMEVTVNMDLHFSKPNYKNLLIVGTYTNKCLKNGYPKSDGLEEFYTFSDTIANKIQKLTKKNKLAGIITYKCTGFDIYYVKDTMNLRNTLNKSIERNFSSRKNYLVLKTDKKWAYFNQKLLPPDLSNEFFVNHEYLSDLVQSGDALDTPRTIKHWFYFNSLKRQTKFVDNIKILNFSIDSVNYKKEKKYPYHVLISRKDSVNPKNISGLTKVLNILSQRNQGIYDGWEMKEIIKD